MSNSKKKAKDHCARLIQKEVSYFNGWAITEAEEERACRKAAVRVIRYLRRRFRKRENELKTELKRCQVAIDRIYGHNAAARAAVVRHYGLRHNIAVRLNSDETS